MSSTYNIIFGDKLIQAIVKFDKKSLVFSMKVEKSKVRVVGKKFKELTQYPLALSVPQHELKLYTILHTDCNKFTLNVNGHQYSALPYMYEPVNPYNQNETILDARIVISNKVISTPLPWNVIDLYNNIKKKFEKNQEYYFV